MKNNFKEIRIVVFLPTLFGGGAEETFIRLVSYLNDNDYDTTLLIGTSNTSSIYEKEIGNRVKVIESPRLRYSILKIFKYLKNAKPDLVISTLWYANIMIFLICKLRTMNENSELNGPEWSSKNDQRVTKIGKFLRKYRLDEIPQLISVIRGEMSLIGPRPERPELENRLKEEIRNYNLKYLLKPGLSGWSQVIYPYGASVYDSEMKLSYDLFYLKNFSLTLDIIIFFKTIKLVFNAQGSEPNL